MKKIFNFLLVIMVVMMPMVTNAQTSIKVVTGENDALECTDDGNGKHTCNVTINITGDGISEGKTLKFVLTPMNATIDVNSFESTLDWVIENEDALDYSNLLVTAQQPLNGQVKVFSFSYQDSSDATESCKVTLTLQDVDKPIPEEDKDVPTEEVKTGVTLPYVFLGGAALLAGYALITTKNKSKMHRI